MLSFLVRRFLANLKSSDGQRGAIRYRNIPIEDLFHNYVYEDVMHLLIWGALPTSEQKEKARTTIFNASVPPQSVVEVIYAFP